MKTINNECMKEMSVQEMKRVDGGVWGPIAIGIATGLFISFINHFGDAREGFSDGIHGRKPRH